MILLQTKQNCKPLNSLEITKALSLSTLGLIRTKKMITSIADGSEDISENESERENDS